MRTLREQERDVVGFDIAGSPFTSVVGSVADRDALRPAMVGVTHVLHTASLHKPHVGSHGRQDFVDTNVVLRTSRFFPEADDRDDVRAAYPDDNLKVNEILYRRVDIADVVDAHLLAAARAPEIGFGRYVISATTPFTRDDLAELAANAPAVVARLCPDQPDAYERLGWRMFPAIERVYVNTRARTELGWTPRFDFRTVLDKALAGEPPRSPLAHAIGAKGYHAVPTGPYTR